MLSYYLKKQEGAGRMDGSGYETAGNSVSRGVFQLRFGGNLRAEGQSLSNLLAYLSSHNPVFIQLVPPVPQVPPNTPLAFPPSSSCPRLLQIPSLLPNPWSQLAGDSPDGSLPRYTYPQITLS